MKYDHSRGTIHAFSFFAVSFLAGLMADAGVAQQVTSGDSDNPPAVPAQEQPEVLSRGPVHEAFAEPVTLQQQAGLIAPERPPQAIEEVPPSERPQGQQYVWIPGYWSWDTDRNGYIWVSACWRVAPPKMSWVPGYWAQVSGGWEWIAGFWTPAGVKEIEYLSAPPTAGDLEPLGVAPSPDTIWVPPCMYWVQGQYVRRAGYWLPAQSNWVWAPAHYVSTPRGYIFAAGHWDYALERRGVLFAPVYFPRAVYGRHSFMYTPSIVIDMGLLRVNLFAYPRYSHYFFGDFYDDAYLHIGIFPWFDSHRHHTWYDPIYEHARWSNRMIEPRWEEHGREEYSRRRADMNLRPARTYREQEFRVAKLPEAQRRTFQVAQPLTTVAARRETPMKFERVTTDTREKSQKQATAVHTFGEERNRWESTTTRQQNKTISPTVGERTERVAQPIPEHRESAQPTKERAAVETPRATTEHRETAQPQRERTTTVMAPATSREAVSSPSRESRSPQTERVQIPASPIVGQSGRSGIIFQKGPPSQPSDESSDRDGRDMRRGRGYSR